jgi:hypothetical protein
MRVTTTCGRLLLASALTAMVAACAAPLDDAGSGAAAQARGDTPSVTEDVVQATDAEREELVRTKVTCPFMGALVWLKRLPIRNTLANPIARIEDLIELATVDGPSAPPDQYTAMGDYAGPGSGSARPARVGSLGTAVLPLFARGNHHKMHGATGGKPTTALTETVPNGTFSLDFPASQGAHPGHSGILLRGLKGSYEGALVAARLAKLESLAVTKDGEPYLRRADLAAFIAANVAADPQACFLGRNLVGCALDDTRDFALRPSVEGLVKFTGTNNHIGSAGEYGLLMTVLEVPGLSIDSEPVVRVKDLHAMFAKHELPTTWGPSGREHPPWMASAWVRHTFALAQGDAPKDASGGDVSVPAP